MSLINIVNHISEDEFIKVLGLILIPLSIFAITFYLLSAFTNPGLLIGNEEVQLQKAQDWNNKHQAHLSKQSATMFNNQANANPNFKNAH